MVAVFNQIFLCSDAHDADAAVQEDNSVASTMDICIIDVYASANFLLYAGALTGVSK